MLFIKKSLFILGSLLVTEMTSASRFNVVCSLSDSGSSPAPSGGSDSSSKPASGSNPPAPSGSSSSATSSSGGGGDGGSCKITQEMFNAASEAYNASGKGKPPVPDVKIYEAFKKFVCPKVQIDQMAMFLANSCWETGGFQYNEELACKDGKWESCPYKKYYGRGFMQLTWDYNYKPASKDLTGSESTFLDKPEMVAEPEWAWKTALWFWNTKVMAELKGSYDFGDTVRIINGGIECAGSPNESAQNRLKILKAIRKAWNLTGKEPTLAGCPAGSGAGAALPPGPAVPASKAAPAA
jgi:predicted chitinase